MGKTAYKPSRYNHGGTIGDDRHIVYNLATSSVAVLSDNEVHQVNSACFEDETLEKLALSNGFVVPCDEDEVEKILAVERMNNYSTRFAGFQILPTTKCNARCWYCYEGDFSKATMTNEVAQAIPKFVETCMDVVDDVHITWFGGEPLLNFGTICDLSDELISICKTNGVGYTSDIITNATLLNEETVQFLIEKCKVSQAQVTFDGLGESHVKRKRYLDQDIRFEDVLHAVNLLIEGGIRLLIRINVDRENFNECLLLIDMLGAQWADKENVMLYVAPLYGCDMKGLLSRDDLNQAYERIFVRMIDTGWIRSLDGLPMNFNNATCSARMINNFVIDPQGNLYKCEHLLSDAKERVGTVFDGITFNDAMARWASPNLPDLCVQCSYLPSCQGGCHAAEALDFGFDRCPHIAFIEDAIVSAAGYLLNKCEDRGKI